MMSPDTLSRLSSPLIALQFAAFGWRVNREIAVSDAGRRSWLPIPDILNILSMFAVIALLIVAPMASDRYGLASRVALGVGYVLIGFHPISMAAHYRLFSSQGRHKYTASGRDYPKVTDQEIVTIPLSLICAGLAGLWIAGKL